jgi:hypothetical protein
MMAREAYFWGWPMANIFNRRQAFKDQPEPGLMGGIVPVAPINSRFWVYQVVDLRSDSFAELGKMYGTKPGFYLLVGPDWNGKVPAGITKVFRARTNTGFVIPECFRTILPPTAPPFNRRCGRDMYPLSQYDGKVKHRDWAKLPKFRAQAAGSGETVRAADINKTSEGC